MRRLLIFICLICAPVLAYAQYENDEDEADMINLPYAKTFLPTRFDNITGSWEKEFIRELRMENRDPRWKLYLEFRNDGQFVYHTRAIEEIRFVTKGGGETARPIAHDTRLKGTYSYDGENLILNFHMPAVSDIDMLSLNLGYNPNSRCAIIRTWQHGEYLALQGLGSPRQIFFRKTY